MKLGDKVTVQEDLLGSSSDDDPVKLSKGSCGIICDVDDDVDVLIKFEGPLGDTWVEAADLPKLSRMVPSREVGNAHMETDSKKEGDDMEPKGNFQCGACGFVNHTLNIQAQMGILRLEGTSFCYCCGTEDSVTWVGKAPSD